MKYAEKVLQMGGDIRCGHRVIQAKRSVSGASVYSPTCSRDGVLLDFNLFGSHYSLDHGASWHDLMLTSEKQLRTHYYPQAVQATDGTIVITSHDKGDDEYRGFDESIWMQSFRIAATSVDGPAS